MHISKFGHDTFSVLVKCMTYNQHSFIEDAMNGFCMQKTDFPYVCVVMDDSSTDGEQDVIKKYVQERFLPITDEETDDYVLHYCNHKTNKNCYFAVYYLKYNHYWTDKNRKNSYLTKLQDTCKYIAICEGDDYWTDENKLQMQVDFLENHNEYSACFHNVLIHKVQEKKIVNNYIFRDVPEDLDVVELAKSFCIPTCSFIYRNDSTIQSKLQMLGRMPFGDYSLELFCAEKGKIKKIMDKLGVYRIGCGINTSTFDNPYKNFERYLQDYMAMAKLWMALDNIEAKKAMQKHLEDDENMIKNLYKNALQQAEEYTRINNISKSFSYKLGKLLTSPFRWIRKIFHK